MIIGNDIGLIIDKKALAGSEGLLLGVEYNYGDQSRADRGDVRKAGVGGLQREGTQERP